MTLPSPANSALRLIARKKAYAPVLLALAISGIFKLAAFGREAYIASRFGVSAETDVYFALQQLPMSLVTFVLGAFGLAFTPAYTIARRTREGPLWIAGMLSLCLSVGLLLTGATLACEPLLLKAIHARPTPAAHSTVLLLALSYVPVLLAGLFVCISNASGRPILSLTAVGIPYLLMTIALVVLCFWPPLLNLSLPASWLIGFTLTAAAGTLYLIKAEPFSLEFSKLFGLVRLSSFQRFLRQLGSSVLENVGFVSNQLLLVFFFGLEGLGSISANNYAMRIGMLGYGLLTIPVAQLTQARLCNVSEEERVPTFVKQLLMMAAVAGTGAAVLCIFREQLVRFIYLRGHFTLGELHAVVDLLPAWFSYFVVISINAVASRMLFVRREGFRYARTMLCAYAISNALRFTTIRHMPASFIVWSAVIGEGLGFLWNLRNCFGTTEAKTFVSATNQVAA